MLDNESWRRLIEGLIQATKKGQLVWERRNATGVYGISGMRRPLLSSIMGRIVLRAQAKSATYEVSSGSINGAPFELCVYRRGEGSRPRAEMVKSSTDVSDPAAYTVNRALAELFNIADSSTEDPDELVDNLLGDFG